jgi:hypothetical protein
MSMNQRFCNTKINSSLVPKKLSDDEIAQFNSAIFELSKSVKNIDLSESDNIKLLFPRVELIELIKAEAAQLSAEEKNSLFKHFNFKLSENGLDGYIMPNFDKSNIKNKKIEDKIDNLNRIFQRFTSGNKILVAGNLRLENNLNIILNSVPQLFSVVGKIQHKTHFYTVDKHSLRVLQLLTSFADWETFTEDEKRLLTMLALFHDISKTERTIDKSHPIQSAKDTFFISENLGLGESEREKLVVFIKYHDWLERINKSIDNANILFETAELFKKYDAYKLMLNFCEADLKSVKSDNEFYDRFKNDLFVTSLKLEKMIF